MTALKLTGAAFAMALVFGSPVSAQMASNGMKSDSMKMTKAEMSMLKKCDAMTHDKMMMDKKCAAIMKAHHDMMSDGMKSDAMKK